MTSETELLRLAMVAYEAASEPALWNDFLARYRDAVSGDSAILQVHNLQKHTSTILSGSGISSPLQASYNEHYSKMNLWREHGRISNAYAPGRVNLSEELCPTALLERSEFYNDYLRPLDGVCCMGAVVDVLENLAPTLTVLRGRRKPKFGEPERQIAGFLLPHLRRAWTVLQRLELLAAGESVLDALPLGVVFLAASGMAVYYNHAADEIFRAVDGLSLRNGTLGAADRMADANLRKAVDHAVSPDRPLGPAAVQIPRTSLQRAYQVVAAPLRGRFRQFAGLPTPVAVVLITDPERRKPANQDLLIQMYSLTPKEAAIAAKLSLGETVEQAAEELAIRYETARTHLRHIFSKTGTSRQTELLLLIARLPPAIESQNG